MNLDWILKIKSCSPLMRYDKKTITQSFHIIERILFFLQNNNSLFQNRLKINHLSP